MAGFERAAPEDDLWFRFKVTSGRRGSTIGFPLLAAEKAFPGWEEVARPFRHDTVEWLPRRLDEALSFLNRYLVI